MLTVMLSVFMFAGCVNQYGTPIFTPFWNYVSFKDAYQEYKDTHDFYVTPLGSSCHRTHFRDGDAIDVCTYGNSTYIKDVEYYYVRKDTKEREEFANWCRRTQCEIKKGK